MAATPTRDKAQLLTLRRTVVSDLTPEVLAGKGSDVDALLGEAGAHPPHAGLSASQPPQESPTDVEMDASAPFLSRESASYVTHVVTSASGSTVATANTRPVIELWNEELLACGSLQGAR
jgi:hypothetical protein